MTLPRRQVSDAWPTLLTPAPGCFPLTTAAEKRERVLHVALYPALDLANSLPRAFSQIATGYLQIDHVRLRRAAPGALAAELKAKCQALRPTLIFIQMQSQHDLTPADIKEVRRLSDPRCVIVQWDGDMHWEPASHHREWFRRLGAMIDASLTAETQHQEAYAKLGVVRPGFLGAGTDETIFRPVAPHRDGDQIVFLASRWKQLVYESRLSVVGKMLGTYPLQFGLHGSGWDPHRCVRRHLKLHEEAAVYSTARAALSISISNQIARYSSDRLLRLLCSGAVGLVERFADCAGLGLVDGENCYLWDTWEELKAHVDRLLAEPRTERHQEMRDAAVALGQEHSWNAKIRELLAIVDTIREVRRAEAEKEATP